MKKTEKKEKATPKKTEKKEKKAAPKKTEKKEKKAKPVQDEDFDFDEFYYCLLNTVLEQTGDIVTITQRKMINYY